MANKKITDYSELTGVAVDDLLEVVDVSDTSEAATGTNKGITPVNLCSPTVLGNVVNGATEKTTPVDADKLPISDSAHANILYYFTWANLKATLKTYFDTLYGTSGSGAGWISLGACTYEGADDPTFTFSLASDVTGVLSVGMRIKLTQTTAKYFIITAVGAYTGGKTIITVYGGTDYDLANAAITVPYYSIQKAPFGFPLDPRKWQVVFQDTTIRQQEPPTSTTWYNLGSAAITIPIGMWAVSYNVSVGIVDSTSDELEVTTTLSTANNSESDEAWSCYLKSISTKLTVEAYKFGYKELAAKAVYYLNTMANGTFTGIYNRNDEATLTIRALCAYL
jgi:hypothetical protein